MNNDFFYLYLFEELIFFREDCLFIKTTEFKFKFFYKIFIFITDFIII